MMDKNINNNGYEYVDLGLPSGTLWAACNVGASKPSEFGMYFQWGDTIGYTINQVGTIEGKKAFRWSDYKFSIDERSSNFSKYTKSGDTLELEDDAAYVHMGGSWHMPTPTQISELLSNTTNTWTTQDGVNGRLFTSKSDTSKSIFIPAVGYASDGSVYSSGDFGGVWSSMLGTDYADDGQYLGFYSDLIGLYYSYRYNGLSVRGVIDGTSAKNATVEMLDLVNILKDVPEGTKLWSPLYGDCEFEQIKNDKSGYPIVCLVKLKGLTHSAEYAFFSAKGEYCVDYDNTECVLFPSKDNRDWSTFKVTKQHKHFEPYQKVLAKVWTDSKTQRWVPVLYGYYDASKNMHFLENFTWVEECGIIPYEGNENKVGTVVK